jgi:hypothetical protein
MPLKPGSAQSARSMPMFFYLLMLSYCCRIFNTNICNLLCTWSSPRLELSFLFVLCMDSGRLLNYADL